MPDMCMGLPVTHTASHTADVVCAGCHVCTLIDSCALCGGPIFCCDDGQRFHDGSAHVDCVIEDHERRLPPE